MRISAAQIDITLGQTELNASKVVQWIGRAREASADLVVFPECALAGYCFDSRDEARQHSHATTDPVWERIALACGAPRVNGQGANSEAANSEAADGDRHPCHAVVGFLERDGDSLYNASALVGPDGIVAVYRKVHLPHLGVDRFVDRGNRPYQVHQAGEMRIGLAICYDSSFPEPMRVLGLERADIIALATNWPVAAERTARIVPPARSMENHLFFIAANRVGRERQFVFCGLSSICGPDGVELASAPDDQETLLVCDVDLAAARNKRIERTVGAHVIDRFADRRPEFYGRVADEI